jgi:PIN domain nuclease of toxin-antitoxin system
VSKSVLDASAILALVQREPGHTALTPAIVSEAVCSTVNLTEVLSKLISRGWSPAEAWEDATGSVREIAPFTSEHARCAGELEAQTRHAGLSLGDRACIALALSLKCPVYTTDKAWREVKLPVKVHLLR